jgi:hypothetical protein
MNWACTNCGSTEPGPRIGHACLCPTCDHEKEAKTAEHFNRAAEARALAEATKHPSGRRPRIRIVHCTCSVPMQVCLMHRGEL